MNAQTDSAASGGVWENFILTNTRLSAPPLVPEIRLHLAAECLPIWQATEDAVARQGVPPPYWAFAWAGGQALARHILDHPSLVAGRRVLDLGAGSGLVAIAAMKGGATRVFGADIDPFAETAIRLNAAANGAGIATTTDDLLDEPLAAFDVVLVGDLFYERALAERTLMRVVEAASRGRYGSLVLAGDPGRTYFPAGRFERIAEYLVPVSRDLEDGDVKKTGVYRLVPS